MDIPKQILEAAKELLKFGGSVVYLGENEGEKVYLYEPNNPEEDSSGFPQVYVIRKDGSVKDISGFESLDIISLFMVEDIDE